MAAAAVWTGAAPVEPPLLLALILPLACDALELPLVLARLELPLMLPLVCWAPPTPPTAVPVLWL
jgi:hypothetical protein